MPIVADDQCLQSAAVWTAPEAAPNQRLSPALQVFPEQEQRRTGHARRGQVWRAHQRPSLSEWMDVVQIQLPITHVPRALPPKATWTERHRLQATQEFKKNMRRWEEGCQALQQLMAIEELK